MARVQKGYFKNTSNGRLMQFMFNPSSISTTRDVKYANIQGCGSAYPVKQYLGGDVETISFNLFLYGDTGIIKNNLTFLDDLLPKKDPKARFTPPPTLIFSFGGSFTEECVLLGLDKDHLGFDSKLNTYHLEVKIKLEVVK